ncbi:hypothetical protein G9A89_016810 [Geosiphon pyriformis]|nr:hypothetical protein G9A89_016810 [Geosiphon pyriformis]
MAHMANIPHCLFGHKYVNNARLIVFDVTIAMIENRRAIIGYFRGPEYSIHEWDRKRFELKSHDWPIYSVWYDVLTSEHFIRSATKIDKLISTWTDEIIPFYFAGHGIGGVYALVVGMNIAMSNKPNAKPNLWKKRDVTVVTFGQPRVGSYKFAQRVNQLRMLNFLKIYRVTHTDDYIPQLPNKGDSGIKYFHSDREYWISNPDCECTASSKTDGYELFDCPGYSDLDSNLFGENKVTSFQF